MSGHPGDDAKGYQVRNVRKAPADLVKLLAAEEQKQ